MAIIPRDEYDFPKETIDLSGPDGNAFMLLGKASKMAKQFGLDGKAITEEMTKGDYKHLCKTFQRHFGDYVDFID